MLFSRDGELFRQRVHKAPYLLVLCARGREPNRGALSLSCHTTEAGGIETETKPGQKGNELTIWKRELQAGLKPNDASTSELWYTVLNAKEHVGFCWTKHSSTSVLWYTVEKI